MGLQGFIEEQLTHAGEQREIDRWERDGSRWLIEGPAGTRSFSAAAAEAFVLGLLAARAGAWLRAAEPDHDAGAYVKAARGEVPERSPESYRRRLARGRLGEEPS